MDAKESEGRDKSVGSKYRRLQDYCEVMNRVGEKSRNRYLLLKRVSEDDSFKLKSDHSRVIAEVSLLEDLYKAVQDAPSEAIAFHLERGNDFADWVCYTVGDWCLGHEMNSVEENDPEKARTEMLRVLGERLSRLRLI